MPKSKKSGTSVHKRTPPEKHVGTEVASGAHADVEEYGSILHSLVDLLDNARRASVRSVNAIMTATYWEIGRRIVEHEQGGAERAEYYGKELVDRLSDDLSRRFGRGFGRRNLFQMRAFYLAYANEIVQTASAQSSLTDLATHFPLSWSHYVRLLSVKNPLAREFYQTESLRGGWSIRQLARQINSQFYERTALSRNKAAMLKKGVKATAEDATTAEEEIKDPLRCLVIIDLKLGEFTHADAGQMHLYLNYAREHWTHSDENPPVGLVLCTQKNEAVAHYALDGLPNKILAAEYRTALPDEQVLVQEVERTRRLLEGGNEQSSTESDR